MAGFEKKEKDWMICVFLFVFFISLIHVGYYFYNLILYSESHPLNLEIHL